MPGNPRKSSPINAEQELKVLSEISNLVQKSPVDTGSFEEILKLLGKIVDYRSASLFLFSGESGKLQEVCTVGRKVELISFVSFEMGNGISAWVAKHRRPIVLNNLRKSKGGTHTKSFLSVPMIFGKEVRGVLNLAHDEPDSYNHRDAGVVSVAVTLMALLAERLTHEELVSSKNRELEEVTRELEAIRKNNSEAKVIPAAEHMLSLNERIENPLAIIAGNAQFLMMTMKNTNPSVLKRLRAIDKEATHLTSIAKSLLHLQPNGRDEKIEVRVGQDDTFRKP